MAMQIMPTPDSLWAETRARENQRLRKQNAVLVAALSALVADIDGGGPHRRALDMARAVLTRARENTATNSNDSE
jgi:Flp pilus assembly protein TadB